ncbi:carboxypeptidase-like regulatory domain-containing protein [Flammeovirga yaeyamensis]|uniref:Carboxypeptidase-like regulatory domain-containing protein n=1 Tax=Flammeovirga yaeyamensis TaxID=367791 RepID=A0AAX1N0W5_9BACT|nr:DUF5686 and carboxypeptidase-like regulatory domain-containing protein [Flammeovirga yaeyamensis]MBB3698510.1 hypothetical protein [Flammeovirga yaeyamensis]NMF34141.1 carboxypeptidase-like regulatory domain-containing protein [Flammeovirga yaeyamensis]QWG01126.1 carboxypeptidase-like regulatory domain-containing protein [Flammeovirga yaeyamensis]
MKSIFFILFLLIGSSIVAQNPSKFYGKIIDATSLRPVPFAHIKVAEKEEGTTTNEKGLFDLNMTNNGRIEIGCLGYKSIYIQTDTIDLSKEQLIVLSSTTQQLEEVVVGRRGYENPAWEIIRLAMKNADLHNFKKSKDYTYQSNIYTHIYFADLDSSFFERKLVNKAISKMQAVGTLEKDKKGIPIVPVYASHSSSEILYNGISEEREVTSYKEAFLGPEFEQQFKEGLDPEKTTINFYQHWMRFLNYDFVSPLNPTFKNYFDYELQTFEKVDNDWCYRITYTPRRENDMTFGGTIWVTDDEKNFAIKKITADIGRSSPINFIDSIHVEQKLAPIDSSQVWLPSEQKIRMYVGGKLNEKWSKFQVDISTQNTFLSDDQELITTPQDSSIFAMIDTVKTMGEVKTTAKLIDMAVTGYYRMGGFDFGSLLALYAQNDVEGHHLQVGGITNTQWNKNFVMGGHIAYGTKDQKWKWGVMGKYVIDQENWTFLYARAQHSLQRLGAGITYPGQDPYLWFQQLWGTYSNPYILDEYKITGGSYIAEGIQLRGSFTYKDENYFTTPTTDSLIFNQITTSEIGGSIIFDFGKKYVTSRHLNRYIAANGKLPYISINYSRGLPNVLNATDSYHKVSMSISHRFKLGAIGRLDYVASAGWTPSTVPFPLLFVHRGNNLRYIYDRSSYNLMGFGEFMSDAYGSIRMFHHFEGLFMNRIPLVKKWNIKTFGITNLLWGGVSDENLAANVNPWDKDDPTFGSLDPSVPYVEVGGGIENIFRMVKVMFLYRATYQETASRKYGIMFAIVPEF